MTRTLALGLSAIAGLAALTVSSRPAPWLVNETASLPRGLYALTAGPPSPGAVVAVTPPPSATVYLATLRAPRGARLLKRVAAGPGDTICRTGAQLIWPRGRVAALDRDRRGRRLPSWQGCRRLAGDELLLVGDTATSFDSRYFGPVRRAAVDGVYREVWRW